MWVPSSLGARFAPRTEHVPGVRFTRRPTPVPAGTVEGLSLNMGYKGRLRGCAPRTERRPGTWVSEPAIARPRAREWDQGFAPFSSRGPGPRRERAGRPAPCAGHTDAGLAGRSRTSREALRQNYTCMSIARPPDNALDPGFVSPPSLGPGPGRERSNSPVRCAGHRR